VTRTPTLRAKVGRTRDDCGNAPVPLRKYRPELIHAISARQGAVARSQSSSASDEQAIQFVIELVQGRWKIGILLRLQHGPTRLSELRRILPQASKKVLTQHLREMERDGLVVRTDLSGKVPHVEYSLSRLMGPVALRLLQTLQQWGTECRDLNADRDQLPSERSYSQVRR
jgi:DNA-binding HxlR family transcriptional regulator